jgi:hypothetical protein
MSWLKRTLRLGPSVVEELTTLDISPEFVFQNSRKLRNTNSLPFYSVRNN